MSTTQSQIQWPGINALAHSQALRYIGEDIPPVAIITSSTTRLRRFRIDEVLTYEGAYPDSVAQTQLWAYGNKRVCTLIGGVGGASFDRIVVTAMLRGVRVFIRLGSAGLVAPGADIGEVIVPTEAIGNSTIFRYYTQRLAKQGVIADDSVVRADERLLTVLRQIGHSGVRKGAPIRFGRIFSTCLMMHEGVDEAQEYLNLGCIASDMETATLFAAAQVYGLHAVALHVGADHILEGGLHERQAPEKFEAGVRTLQGLLHRLLLAAFDITTSAS